MYPQSNLRSSVFPTPKVAPRLSDLGWPQRDNSTLSDSIPPSFLVLFSTDIHRPWQLLLTIFFSSFPLRLSRAYDAQRRRLWEGGGT